MSEKVQTMVTRKMTDRTVLSEDLFKKFYQIIDFIHKMTAPKKYLLNHQVPRILEICAQKERKIKYATCVPIKCVPFILDF